MMILLGGCGIGLWRLLGCDIIFDLVVLVCIDIIWSSDRVEGKIV